MSENGSCGLPGDTRCGATFGIALDRRQTLRLAYFQSATTRIGSDIASIYVTYQVICVSPLFQRRLRVGLRAKYSARGHPEGWVGARRPFIAAPPNRDLENALLGTDLFNDVFTLLIFHRASRGRPFPRIANHRTRSRRTVNSTSKKTTIADIENASKTFVLRSDVRSIDTPAQSGSNRFSSGRDGLPCRGSWTSNIACCSRIHRGQSKCPQVAESRGEYPTRRRCKYRATNQCSGRI